MNQTFSFVYEKETPITDEEIERLSSIYEADANSDSKWLTNSFAEVGQAILLLASAANAGVAETRQTHINDLKDSFINYAASLEDNGIQEGRLFCILNFMQDNKDVFDFSYIYD